MRENLNNELTQRCHPEAQSAVRVSGQVGAVFGSQGPHGSKAPSGRPERCEGGRSMVEMLGTLAIMGVLAIGGVAGYRSMVDKSIANDIVDGVMKRAVVASQQRILGHDIDLREFTSAKIKDEYIVTPVQRYNNSASYFALDVALVPQDICDKVIDNKPRQVVAVLVNNKAVEECPAEDATITFAFANTFNMDETVVPAEETRCQTNDDCKDDSAKPVCGTYGYCEPCPSGTKWNETKCEIDCGPDKILDGNTCVCAPINGCLGQDEDTCKCTGGCDGGSSFFDDGEGGCSLSCATGTEPNADGSGCQNCGPDEDCGCPAQNGTGSVSNGYMACMCGQGYEPVDDCPNESGFDCACQQCTGANVTACQNFEYNSCKCSVCKDGYTLNTNSGLCELNCNPGWKPNTNGTACEVCEMYPCTYCSEEEISQYDNCGCQDTYGYYSAPDGWQDCTYTCFRGSNSECPDGYYCDYMGAPYMMNCMEIGSYTEIKENGTTIAVMSERSINTGISLEMWCERVTGNGNYQTTFGASALGCSVETGECSKVADGIVRISTTAWAGYHYSEDDSDLNGYYTVDSNGNYKKSTEQYDNYPVICKGAPKNN